MKDIIVGLALGAIGVFVLTIAISLDDAQDNLDELERRINELRSRLDSESNFLSNHFHYEGVGEPPRTGQATR